MKISYGIFGLVIILAVLVALWHVGSPPPVVEAIKSKKATFLAKEIKHFDQPQSAKSAPVLPTPDEFGIDSGLAELPILKDMPDIPYNTGPFIDADPSKPVTQSSYPGQLPQNAGVIVDADGPPVSNSRTLGAGQNQ